MKRFIILCAALTACGPARRDPTVTYVWEVMGTTLSLAAWGRDSTALQAAANRLIDSVRVLDSVSNHNRASVSTVCDELRRAWATVRASVKPPDCVDVLTGYALDRGAQLLSGAADSALFDFGGQFLWIGAPTRRSVGIADPDNSLSAVAHVDLQNGSVNTVSDAHRSVTVLAPSALMAAAWTAVLIPLGCDSALARVGGGPSLICADTAGVRWSADLEGRVTPAGEGRSGRGP